MSSFGSGHWLRIIIDAIFFIAYVAGVMVFAVVLHNHWAATGFAVTAIFIAFDISLHLVRDDSLFRMFPAGTVKRAAFQLFWICCFLAFVALAIYLLVLGVRLRKWNAQSDLCGFIAFLAASKWALICGFRLHRIQKAHDKYQELPSS